MIKHGFKIEFLKDQSEIYDSQIKRNGRLREFRTAFKSVGMEEGIDFLVTQTTKPVRPKPKLTLKRGGK